jgi:hypothetical protein
VVDERLQDLQAMGAPQDVIDKIIPAEHSAKDADFEVWEENWLALEMWLQVCTQWRVGMNGPVGLDYNVLRWLFELYDVEDKRALFEDLQIMETAFLTLKTA